MLVLRGGAAARGCQARRHDVEDNVISGCQAPPVNAPLARRRAAFGRADAPLPIWDRADSGPLAAFSSLRSVGMAGRPIPPRSSRRNAPRGPNSSRSLTLRCALVSRGLVQSFSIRGRRGGCAAPGAAATGLYCGPRYAAIWHANAHQLTTPRGPRNEALRNSATPTGTPRQRIQAEGRQIRNPKSEIRNSCDGRAAFLIPNS